MIKPEQVPTECLIAYAEAHRTGGIPAGIAAALNAWPGMRRRIDLEQALILPLNQEPSDAER